MKIRALFLLLLITFCSFIIEKGFKEEQQKAPRVKAAYTEKWQSLQNELWKKGFDGSRIELLIRAFKHEKIVEVWIKSPTTKLFSLFKTYNICYYSGDLGPKRKQGDGQVPEGFYTIAVFNPYSSYHLSLGVSYPNASDKIIGKGNLGGDIMIHGNCVSIGCIPITDYYIKELYVLAVEARNGGQTTLPVQIFPAKMDDAGMNYLNTTYSNNSTMLAFWKNLKEGYDYFDKNKKLPKVSVNKEGKYVFQ